MRADPICGWVTMPQGHKTGPCGMDLNKVISWMRYTALHSAIFKSGNCFQVPRKKKRGKFTSSIQTHDGEFQMGLQDIGPEPIRVSCWPSAPQPDSRRPFQHPAMLPFHASPTQPQPRDQLARLSELWNDGNSSKGPLTHCPPLWLLSGGCSMRGICPGSEQTTFTQARYYFI